MRPTARQMRRACDCARRGAIARARTPRAVRAGVRRRPRREQLDDVLTRYPTKMAALLPALWMVQDEPRLGQRGGRWPRWPQVLDLTPAYVKGVVTFYTMYHQHPVGKHFIQVCTTSPCDVCGAEDVRRRVPASRPAARSSGVTSADGKYTVIEVECLGACGFATPVHDQRATSSRS